MLKVQEYLRSGKSLESLTETLGIKNRRHQKYNNLVLLKYDMIRSPMTNPIVQECRGLILDEARNWDLVSLAFTKFFNLDEDSKLPDFDFNNFKVMDKLDGSLIQIYHYNGGWEIGTSGTPDAFGDCGNTGITFRDLVLKTVEGQDPDMWRELDTNRCYAFELLAAENQVVVYHACRSLILTGSRDRSTQKELDIWDQVSEIPKEYKVGYVEGFDIEAVRKRVQELNGNEAEGFVIMDKDFNRIKVKNDTYVFMSRSRDSFSKSPRACVQLIMAEGVDDVRHLLPDFVQERISKYSACIKKLGDELTLAYAECKDIEDQRDFALKVQHQKHGKTMFMMRKNKFINGADLIRWYCTDNRGDLHVSRKTMEFLGIFDREEEE